MMARHTSKAHFPALKDRIDMMSSGVEELTIEVKVEEQLNRADRYRMVGMVS
jgi:hypothetical protein